MNAEQLLAQYERMAEAPDAISRLRDFVVELAVRGKLLPQVQTDEPATEQLKRIAADKGAIRARAGRNAGRERQEGFEFSLPAGWALSTLGEVAQKITDGAHKTPTYVDAGVPFVSVKDFSAGRLSLSNTRLISEVEHRALYKRCDPRRGDILIGRIGTLGRAVLVDTDVEFSLFVSVGLIRFDHEHTDARFFRLLLNSPVVAREFDRIKIGGGTHTNKLNLGDLHTVALPLPPLAEQQRIVAKVDELMSLCDRLEEARTRREATRDRLTASTFARLNTPEPPDFLDGEASKESSFQSDARFALKILPALTTRPDQIKQLRQTIFNIAVRGKLSVQDPSESPALAADAHAGAKSDWPFDIPANWRWSRLSSLGTLRGGGTPSKARHEFWIGEIPWVSPKDMKVDYIADAQMHVSDAAITGSAATLIERGSILFVVRGMILAHSFPVAITHVPVTINQDMKALTLKRPEMAEYVLRALKGLKPEMLTRVQRSSHGTCRLEGNDYCNFPVPIPPIAEQSRIVAKLDELMAFCDQLEASLTHGENTRSRLLNALLHEALAPTESVLEAA